MPEKIIIQNAEIATEAGVFTGSVLVRGEIIAKVYHQGEALPDGPDARVIDGGGLFLLPGGVDAHTHFGLRDDPARSPDDFFAGTAAAACGGTTTVIEHPGFGPAGCALSHQPDSYRRYAEASAIDYGLHGVIQHVDEAMLADMARLRDEAGITSFKIYLTYAHRLHNPEVLQVLRRAKQLGVTVCVHCENDAIIEALRQRQEAEGTLSPRFHPLGRPPEAEAEAVFRMLMLASISGQPRLYIVHLSTALGLQAIRSARAAGGQNIYAETCPQYLLLDDSLYKDDEESLKYIMAPPLRKPADMAALWQALAAEEADTVATDHCPFTFAGDKLRGAANYQLAAGGIPGAALRLPLMFSEGYLKGRLTLPRLVGSCCGVPARLFGLAGRKGAIREGADADLVLFDPAPAWTVRAADLHEGSDYTPYEGMRLRGKPVLTLLRGQVVAENGRFCGARGQGRYLRRQPAAD